MRALPLLAAAALLLCAGAAAQAAEPLPTWLEQGETLSLTGSANVCLRYGALDLNAVDVDVGVDAGALRSAVAHLVASIGRFVPLSLPALELPALPLPLPLPAVTLPPGLFSVPVYRAWSVGVVGVSAGGLEDDFSFVVHSDPSVLCAAATVAAGNASWTAGAFCGRAAAAAECQPSSVGAGCQLVVSAFDNPCVQISPESEWTRYSVSLHTALDPTRPAALVGGALLLSSALALSRSRLVHYAVGATMGVAASVLAAVYFLYRHSRNVARSLPGGDALMTYSSVAVVMMPTAGYMVLKPLVDSFGLYALQQLAWLWAHPSHYGKAYFAVAGGLGMLAVRLKGWFRAHPCDECGDVAVLECARCRSGAADGEWRFCADCHADYERLDFPDSDAEDDEDHDGPHEVEELSLLGQRTLESSFWVAGLLLLLHSTHHVLLSAAITLVVCQLDSLRHAWWTLRQWWAYRDPARYRRLLSDAQYEGLGRRYTELEVEKLRDYLRDNELEIERVHEDHEVRLRRFVHGQPHYRDEDAGLGGDVRSGGVRWWWWALAVPVLLAAVAAVVAQARPDLVEEFRGQFRSGRW